MRVTNLHQESLARLSEYHFRQISLNSGGMKTESLASENYVLFERSRQSKYIRIDLFLFDLFVKETKELSHQRAIVPRWRRGDTDYHFPGNSTLSICQIKQNRTNAHCNLSTRNSPSSSQNLTFRAIPVRKEGWHICVDSDVYIESGTIRRCQLRVYA